jgi:hypothetical protein
MVLQEAKCPVCRGSWDLKEADFVRAGDRVECKFGCGPFKASKETITCCMEDASGMVETSLPGNAVGSR